MAERFDLAARARSFRWAARGVFALCARAFVFVDDVSEERFEVFADLGRATTSLGVSSDLNFASAVHKK